MTDVTSAPEFDDNARQDIRTIAEYIAAPGSHHLPEVRHLFPVGSLSCDIEIQTQIVKAISDAAHGFGPRWEIRLATREAFDGMSSRSTLIYMIARKLPEGQTAPAFDPTPVTDPDAPGFRVELASGTPLMVTTEEQYLKLRATRS